MLISRPAHERRQSGRRTRVEHPAHEGRGALGGDDRHEQRHQQHPHQRPRDPAADDGLGQVAGAEEQGADADHRQRHPGQDVPDAADDHRGRDAPAGEAPRAAQRVGRGHPGGAAGGHQVADRGAADVDDQRLAVAEAGQRPGEGEGVEPQPAEHEDQHADGRGRPTWCSTANTSCQDVLAKCGRPQTTRPTARPSPTRPCTTWRSVGRHRTGGGGAELSGAVMTSPRVLTPGPRTRRGRRAAPGGCVGVDVPLTAEDQVEQRAGDAQEGRQRAVGAAVGGGLGGVGAHRGALRAAYRRTPMRWVTSARGLNARWNEVAVELRREAVEPAGQRDRPADGVAGDGRLQHPRRLRQHGGPRADLVHLDVVAVAVAAVAVVGQQHVGAFLAQDGGEAARGLLDVGPHEPDPARRVGQRLRPEAAVGVTEVLHPLHPQGSGALAQLLPSSLTQAPVRSEFCGGQPLVAVGGDHERRPGGPPRRRAPASPTSAAPRRRGGHGRPAGCGALVPS